MRAHTSLWEIKEGFIIQKVPTCINSPTTQVEHEQFKTQSYEAEVCPLSIMLSAPQICRGTAKQELCRGETTSEWGGRREDAGGGPQGLCSRSPGVTLVLCDFMCLK